MTPAGPPSPCPQRWQPPPSSDLGTALPAAAPQGIASCVQGAPRTAATSLPSKEVKQGALPPSPP